MPQGGSQTSCTLADFTPGIARAGARSTLFTLAFGVLISNLEIGVYAKFFIVLSLTTIVSFTSYHFWVRDTPIGLLLNGKRYPRAAMTGADNTRLDSGGTS